MLIGIISDTHDHVEHIKKAVKRFKSLKTDIVIHAGDFCSPFTIPLFKGLNLHGVFGNNDGDHFRILNKAAESNVNIHGEFGSFEINERKIAVYHGTISEITEALVMSGNYDLVISGHTHEPHVIVRKKSIWVNPGTAHGFSAEPTIAIYDTVMNSAEIIQLNESE